MPGSGTYKATRGGSARPPPRRSLPFGAVIRKAREKAGLTQAELAELCGVSQVAVAHWESGRRPLNERTIRLVAHVLKLRVTLRVA